MKVIDRIKRNGESYYFREYLPDFDESFGEEFGGTTNAEWNVKQDERIKYLEDHPAFIPIAEEEYYEQLHFDEVKENVLYLVLDDPYVTELVEKINGNKSGVPSTYYKYLPLIELINGVDYGIDLWTIKQLIIDINDGYDSESTDYTSLEDILLEITDGMTMEEYRILKLIFQINDTVFGKPSEFESVESILSELLDSADKTVE